MIRTLLLSFLVFGYLSLKAQHKLTLLWETAQNLPVPESVLPDEHNRFIYVSMVDGLSAEMDGKGEIARLRKDGTIIDLNWATGLHAPKGMGLVKDKLYVADLDAVAVIDTNTGKVLNRIAVIGAQMLNDLTVANDGLVYVTDSKAGKIHVIKNGQPSVLLDALVNPNGILAIKDQVYFLDSGVLYALDKKGSRRTLAKGMAPSTDGLQQVNDEDFLVSAWAGALYYVTGSGEVQLLLDSEQEKINTADFFYDSTSRTLYVPTFYHKSIRAYRLD